MITTLYYRWQMLHTLSVCSSLSNLLISPSLSWSCCWNWAIVVSISSCTINCIVIWVQTHPTIISATYCGSHARMGIWIIWATFRQYGLFCKVYVVLYWGLKCYKNMTVPPVHAAELSPLRAWYWFIINCCITNYYCLCTTVNKVLIDPSR